MSYARSQNMDLFEIVIEYISENQPQEAILALNEGEIEQNELNDLIHEAIRYVEHPLALLQVLIAKGAKVSPQDIEYVKELHYGYDNPETKPIVAMLKRELKRQNGQQ